MSMAGRLETNSNGQFSTVVEWSATRESAGKGVVIKVSLFIKPQVSILIGGSLSSITIDGDRRQTNSGNQYHAGHTYLIQEMTKRVEYDSNGVKKIRLSSEAIAFDQRSSSPSPLAQRTDNEIELDPILRPDFADFSYRSTTEKISALLGTDKIIVEKKSALEIAINPNQAMIAKEGSSPSFYYFNFCGKSFSAPYEKNKVVAIRDILIDDCSDNKITVSAVDNRGMSTSVIKSVTILKYAPPTLNIVAKRRSNFERATEIKVDGTFSRLIVEGADKNSIKPGSLRYRVRKTGEDWSSWVEKDFSINGEKCVIENTYLNLDNAFSWEIEFEIEDLVGEKTSQTAQVGSGVPLLMISDSTGGVGIGKMPAKGRALDVKGKIYMNEKPLFTPQIIRIHDDTHFRTVDHGSNPPWAFLQFQREAHKTVKNIPLGAQLLVRAATQYVLNPTDTGEVTFGVMINNKFVGPAFIRTSPGQNTRIGTFIETTWTNDTGTTEIDIAPTVSTNYNHEIQIYGFYATIEVLPEGSITVLK